MSLFREMITTIYQGELHPLMIDDLLEICLEYYSETKYTYYPGTSKVCNKYMVVNGVLHGNMETYDTKGELISHGKYDRGKKTGFWLERVGVGEKKPDVSSFNGWYRAECGEYVDDKKVGDWNITTYRNMIRLSCTTVKYDSTHK